MICVVTPWRISPCERPSAISDSVDQQSMLMKPGATARPAASIDGAAASAFERSPTAAMRSPDPDVGQAAGASGAVVDRPAADQDVEGHLFHRLLDRTGRREKRRGGEREERRRHQRGPGPHQ